jgi:hypothetical protein
MGGYMTSEAIADHAAHSMSSGETGEKVRKKKADVEPVRRALRAVVREWSNIKPTPRQ